MGFISDMFSTERPAAITFEKRNQTFSSGVVGPETWTYLYDTNGLFFVGSSIDRIVGERVRADVDAVILLDYADVRVETPDTSRCKIGDNYFSIVYMDNVANQNEMYVVSLKKYVG